MYIDFSKTAELSPQAGQLLQAFSGFFGQPTWFNLLVSHVYPLESGHITGYLTAVDAKGQAFIICPVRYVNSRCGVRRFYSLGNYYTPEYNLSCADSGGNAYKYYAEFFQELRGYRWRWHEFILQAMLKDDVDALAEQLSRAKIPSIRFFCFANWYLPVTFTDFDTYMNTRSSRVRNTVRRKTQAFKRLENTRIELLFKPEQLSQAEKDYAEVYNDSWKTPEPYPQFLVGLIRLAAEHGGLRMAIAYIGVEPVAAQFWIVADNTAYIYKLAYKEAYKSLGIGTVLTAALMQHVLDVDQVAAVDYLSGDDEYKKDWMTHRRERWGILVFNATTKLGCLLYWTQLFKQGLKKIINR